MRIFLAIVLCAVSILAFAGESQVAPVVDADQDAQNTQIESVGAPWQNMQGGAAPEKQESQPQPKTQVQQQPQPVQANSSDTSTVADSNSSEVAVSSGGLDERVNRLSQQVANMTQMNLPQQVTELRETLALLQGQIEVAQRDLKMLSQQQARLYQDLSQRLTKMTPGKSIASKSSAAASGAGSGDPASESMTSKKVPPTEASSYQTAFELLSNKQFDKAKAGFLTYLKTYPQGSFAANAHYWLGEIAMQKKAYDDAYAQFQLLIAQYPSSNKVADAKLKVAVIHAETGKKDLAKIEFHQVQKAYPGSTAAQLASIQLQQMQH